MLTINIHCHRILWHIRIVDTIAVNLLSLHPGRKSLAIFNNTIGEHRRTLCEGRRRFNIHLTSSHLAQFINTQIKQQKTGSDGAVIECIAFVTAQARCFAQIEVRGQHGGLPTRKLG